MKFPLRELIETICQKTLLAAMPDIHSGLSTALGAFALAADEKKTAALMASDLDGVAHGELMLSHPTAILADAWVEMNAAAGPTPLLGTLPGTHVLCGSAINPQAALSGPAFDMFLFIALVDAAPPAEPFTITQLKSLSASPLQVRLSRGPGGEAVFQYKIIGRVRTQALARELIRRDLTFHKLAISLLCECEDAQAAMRAALHALPEWLREPTL
jgi:hypothetical protein